MKVQKFHSKGKYKNELWTTLATKCNLLELSKPSCIDFTILTFQTQVKVK